MPEKIKSMVDGKEVEREVFSAEELAAQAEERGKKIAEEQIAAEREKFEVEKASAIEEKEQEFAEEKEELEKLRKKDLNFENLRRSKELTAEQKKEQEENTKRMKDLEATVDEIKKQPLESARTTFIESNFDSDDKDQRELFDYFYKKLAVGAKSMEEVNKALVAAFNATTGGNRQPSKSGAIVRTGVSETFDGEGAAGRESEASREFGQMLGLKPEDKKRFAHVLKTNSVSLFSKNPPKQAN